MPSALAGIDPHQDSMTVGIIDLNGVEVTHQTFPTTSAGYIDAIDLLHEHNVDEHQTVHDTTAGVDRPLGQRGAEVADTVGEFK